MSKKIHLIADGDVLIAHHGETLVLVCCDCDLAHKYLVQVDGVEKRVCLTPKRDRRLTKRLRRRDKIKVKAG